MNNDEKILKILEDLQSDVKTLNGKVDAVELKVGAVEQKVDAVELKVEAIHDYQKKAHTEIMDHIIESNEINGQADKELEKRIERIEKYLKLPPVK
jgi:outer membrane murein-binding lipoprotein Lpp